MRSIPILLFILIFGILVQAWADNSEFEKSITRKFLPYQDWDREYRGYFQRHYHDDSLELVPKVIVMHYTASDSISSAYNTFKNGAFYDDGDVGVVFGHLSSHFIIDKDGKVYQTLPLNRRCRGAYGVNHVAISVEMVAVDEKSLIGNANLLTSSYRLVHYLTTKFGIPGDKVYGHYQVARGKACVPEYTDYGDLRSPDRYPPTLWRSDPGETYMKGLWKYLRKSASNLSVKEKIK